MRCRKTTVAGAGGMEARYKRSHDEVDEDVGDLGRAVKRLNTGAAAGPSHPGTPGTHLQGQGARGGMGATGGHAVSPTRPPLPDYEARPHDMPVLTCHPPWFRMQTSATPLPPPPPTSTPSPISSPSPLPTSTPLPPPATVVRPPATAVRRGASV